MDDATLAGTRPRTATIGVDHVADRIVVIRGRRVLLDRDLAAVYGLSMSRNHASRLAASIAQAAGLMTASVLASTAAMSLLKGLTLGKSTLITAVPQGLAGGFGSYIVGQAAQYYFEHGAS